MEGKLTSPDAQHSSAMRDMRRPRFQQAAIISVAGAKPAVEKFGRGGISGSLVQFIIDGLAVDVQLSSRLTNVEEECAIRHMKMRTDEVCDALQIFRLNYGSQSINLATLSFYLGF